MHSSTGSVHATAAARQPKDSLTVTLPANWQSAETPQTGLSRTFEMLLFRNDHRVLLSVGRQPGQPNATVLQAKRMMTGVQEESINQLGTLPGAGVFAYGKDADDNTVAYVTFNPKVGTPLQDYYVLGVFFALDKPSEAEFEQVVNSIQVVGASGTASRR
jgi:hypothetical protein